MIYDIPSHPLDESLEEPVEVVPKPGKVRQICFTILSILLDSYYQLILY